jgi:hypothetical protein
VYRKAKIASVQYDLDKYNFSHDLVIKIVVS